MSDNSRIWAAHALSNKKAAISVGKLRHDDPFSSVLIFDEDFEAQWGFVDIPRTIFSITSSDVLMEDKVYFISMSDEGDVYYLMDDVPVEKIIGAGAYSEDSDDLGVLNFITNSNGHLYACGNGSQVYKRDHKNEWHRICEPKLIEDEICSFVCMASLGKNAIFVCGSTGVKHRIPSQKDIDYLEELLQGGKTKEYMKKSREFKSVEHYSQGCMYYFDGRVWRGVELPNSQFINSMVNINHSKIVAVGGGGTIISGPSEGEFVDGSVSGITETLVSVQAKGEKIFTLGETTIFIFDYDLLFLESIPLPNNFQEAFSIDVKEDVIWLFGRFGMARYISGQWDIIDIPPNMWARAN